MRTSLKRTNLKSKSSSNPLKIRLLTSLKNTSKRLETEFTSENQRHIEDKMKLFSILIKSSKEESKFIILEVHKQLLE